MKITRTSRTGGRRRRVLASSVLTAVGLVATVGGVSYATADHAASSPTPTTTSSHAAGATGQAGHRRGGLLGRAEHGQLVVRRQHQDVTLDVQRGTLTAVDVTGSTTATISVRSLDGYTRTYEVTGTSKVRSAGSTVAVGTLATGEAVGVLARVSGATATVTRLVIRPAAHAQASPSAS